MKTCRRFDVCREEFEREILFLSTHAQRHADRPSGKASALYASSAKRRMARALSNHINRCLECG
nr:hypothetical protein [Streptomyces yokosukanensis]